LDANFNIRSFQHRLVRNSPQWPGIDLGDARVQAILDVIVQEAKVDRAALRLDAEVADLGITSLDLTLIVCEVENRFHMDISALPELGPQSKMTVGDLVVYALEYVPDATVPDSGAVSPSPRLVNSDGI
jgi:acyl carrier protein